MTLGYQFSYTKVKWNMYGIFRLLATLFLEFHKIHKKFVGIFWIFSKIQLKKFQEVTWPTDEMSHI